MLFNRGEALPDLCELDLPYGSLSQLAIGKFAKCPHLTHVSLNGWTFSGAGEMGNWTTDQPEQVNHPGFEATMDKNRGHMAEVKHTSSSWWRITNDLKHPTDLSLIFFDNCYRAFASKTLTISRCQSKSSKISFPSICCRICIWNSPQV